MIELALGVLGIWLVWQIADVFLSADRWLWWTILLAAGVGYQCAFLNESYWWQGLGIGGGAAFLGAVADCLLLVGDAARVHVLRNSRTPGP